MSDHGVDEMLRRVESDWAWAQTADWFRRLRLLEPEARSPFVWSPMALHAVDPMKIRASWQALAVAAPGLDCWPSLMWFSAETESALAYYASHGGLPADCWSTSAPIDACCDVATWEIRLHVDVDLADVDRLVAREVAALSFTTYEMEIRNVRITP